MLQLTGDTITETGATYNSMVQTGGAGGSLTSANCGSLTVGSTFYPTFYPYTHPVAYWMNYPVYVCSDKTKKAIDVLKALQSEKLLKCDSVPRFIALVEKISGLL